VESAGSAATTEGASVVVVVVGTASEVVDGVVVGVLVASFAVVGAESVV
jgi:hypothetical protein